MAESSTDPQVSGLVQDLTPFMAEGPLPAEVVPKPEHRPLIKVESLSLVIPAKNESGNLPVLLADLQATLAAVPEMRHEILVIDDGSTDGTAECARAAGARVISHPQSLGNGAAIKRGIRAARCDWVLMMDADGQHPPEAIPGLLALAGDYDMVVAARRRGAGSWHRNLANATYNGLASYVTSRKIPDLTSGFRLVRSDVAKRLVYLLPNTFSYPTTITLAMLRGGYSVGFLPFNVRERGGKSHIRLLQDGSRFFLIILRIATIYAPLRVFLPLSLLMAAIGFGWYAYTYLVHGRFTNMAALVITQATVIFALGLISEQVSALRYARVDEEEG
ncbi:MAG: glycosyltransferase family 2 protein [Planctomycetota bacterium]|jgi:glycosyltransferase involved in cell wall biosynthesis